MKNSVFITLAFIAVTFSFLACTVKSSEDNEKFEDYEIPNLVPKGRLRSHRENSFLAGEDTPCWVITDSLNLERIHDKPVKTAVYRWWTSGNLLAQRMTRSVNSSTALIADVPELLHRKTIENSKNVTKVTRRSVSTPTRSRTLIVEHVYPTMLVVMEYFHPEYEDMKLYDDLRNTFIKYALAFWNSVNIRLQRIKKPIIQLRIGGIVIAFNKKQFREKYVMNDPKLTSEKLHKLFRENNDWTKEIPTSSYDFIVLMTGYNEYQGRRGYIAQTYDQAFDNAHYSKWKTPCGPYSQSVGDVIFWDDFNFIGITSAVSHLLHVFGARDNAVTSSVTTTGWWDGHFELYDLKEPDSCSWDLVKFGLGNAWCMSQPKTHFPPGKRVPIIMPGDLIDRDRRCRNLGHRNGLYADSNDCGSFTCHIYTLFSTAGSSIGDDLDGASCGDGKVCINNKCVMKTWGDK